MKNKPRKTSKKLNAHKMFKGGSQITINDKPYVYNVGMPIGQGKYGSVYIATDQENEKYALKIVKSRYQDIDVLINNEMNILKKLQPVCDEFILCVSDYEKIDGFHYIVTEYLDGYIDFFDYIVGDDYPTDDQYIKIIDNLCKGLIKIHHRGIAHRDIKPENIMIHPETLKIKYIDFGSSCSNNNTVSNFNQICNHIAGTPEYYDQSIDYPKNNLGELTPDFFNKLQKSDIFSLGMTIFVLISKGTSEYPFNPIQASSGYDNFKQYISALESAPESALESAPESALESAPESAAGISNLLKSVLSKATILYDKGKKQHKHTLDLVKAFADDINEREIYSPKKINRSSLKRNHSSIKRSHGSPIHKRSRISPIHKRITQKSRTSILRSKTI